MAAVTAFSGGVIFKKFNNMAAFGTFCLKNGTRLPVSAVLPWAFHDKPSV